MFDFSPSTWANIIFVAVASLGGLFCAFHFFNGADVIRATAAWPAEFLDPQPISSSVSDHWPDLVDQIGGKKSDSKKKNADAAFDRDFFPSDLKQPGATPGTFDPARIGGVAESKLPGDPFSRAGSAITSGLNFLPRGADAISQSFYQRATSTVSKSVKRVTHNTVSSTRHKVTRIRQNVSGKVSPALNRTSSTRSSTRSTGQKTTAQLRGGQRQVKGRGGRVVGSVGSSVGNGVGVSIRGGTGGPIGAGLGGTLGNGPGGGVGGASGAGHGPGRGGGGRR